MPSVLRGSIVASAACAASLALAPAAGAWIYWGQEESGAGVGRAALDGTQVNSSFIPPDPSSVSAFTRGVGVDGSYIYWGANPANPGHPSTIGRAPLSGANPNYTFTGASGFAGVLGIGVFGSELYWTAADNDRSYIGQTASAGGQASQVIQSKFGATNPHSCGVASDGTYVYWANPDTASIGREKVATFGTPEPQEGQWIRLPSSPNEFVHPCGVAVDENYVYWGVKEITRNGVEEPGTTIGRARKSDGLEASDNFAGAGKTVTGVAIFGGALYTSNLGDGLRGHGTIGRASIGGGGGEPNFVTGLTRPFGVAVDAGGPGGPPLTPSPPPVSVPSLPPVLCPACGNPGASGSDVPADFSRVWTINPVFAPAPWSTPGYAVATSAKAAKGAAKGTVFNYILDKAATVTIVIMGTGPGKRVGRRCVAPSRRNLARRRCSRQITFATLRRLSAAGHNEVPFSGRTAGRALKPGAYKAVFISSAATGTATRSKSFAFRIVRR